MIATTSIAQIEEEALELQREMWDRQFSKWPGEKLTRLDMCNPRNAAEYLNFEVQEGFLTSPDPRYRVAGFVDLTANLIAVSDDQTPRAKRFTLAHEIGHIWLEHPGMHHHREKPMDGLQEREAPDPNERQANGFAGFLLVPTSLLTKAFRPQFGREPVRLTDDVAYELLREEYMSLMNSPPNSLALERRIAMAERFEGRRFSSLCDLFQVSVTTMAIRLRQSGLVRR